MVLLEPKKKLDNFMGTLGLEGSEGSKLKYEELWEYKALIPNLEKKGGGYRVSNISFLKYHNE